MSGDRQVEEFGGAPRCTIIGGGKTAPARAVCVNGALVRHLDFNDSFLASRIVPLECLRRGIWGSAEAWGRVLTYKGSPWLCSLQ